MKLRLTTFTTVFLTALIVIAVGNVVAIRGSFRELDVARDWIEHTHTVLQNSQSLMTALVDMETALRGSFLSAPPSLLSAYEDGLTRSNKIWSRLDQLTADNPLQQARLSSIRNSIDEITRTFEQAITLDQQGQWEQAVDMVRREAERQYMNQIRRQLDDLIREENHLLAQRLHTYDEARRRTGRWYIGGTVVVFIIALLFYAMLRQTIVRPVQALSRSLKRFGDGAPYQNPRGHYVSAEAAELIEVCSDMAQTLMTKQTALSEALTQADISNRALKASNRELEAFSYSVSHDLRAPLRAVDGFSRILLKSHAEQLNDEGKDLLGRMREAARRMARLIDDMLTLSRIGRAELSMESVDLSALGRETIGQLQDSNPTQAVEVNIQPDMWADADPRLLRIVLDNLLGNAWKFTGKTALPRIEFGCEHSEAGTAFYIRDNGAGFDMAYADKLFGAFQRLHGMEDFPGTGIGLATVQRIINKHGGRVWAEGKVDHGATFRFTLRP